MLGIQVPSSEEEALAIDKVTYTTFWYDAIQKETNKQTQGLLCINTIVHRML